MEKDPLPRWTEHFTRLSGDLRNAALGHHVYKTLEFHLAANPYIELGDPSLVFIELWYIQAIALTLRRHVKDNPDSHSLIGLLKQIRKRPEVLKLTANDVTRDIDTLVKLTKSVENYADRTVAHLDKRGVGELPKFSELDDALDHLRGLCDVPLF